MKRVFSIILALLFVFVLAACGGGGNGDEVSSSSPTGSSPTGSSPTTTGGSGSTEPPSGDREGDPRYGGTVRIIAPSEGAGPLGVPWELEAVDVYLVTPFLECLVRQLPDGTMLPHLAASWDFDESDPEDVRLIFYLRDDVFFHDGSKFNAETVKWNLDMSNEFGAPMASYSDIQIVDEYTVSMRIPSVTNSTLSGFTGLMYSQISKEGWDNNGEEWSLENPIGTGPFVMTEYVRGVHVKTVRNENYWNPNLPFFDALEYHLIGDVMTQNIALQTDGPQGIDMLGTMSGDQVSLFREMGYTILLTSPISMTLMPSTDNPDSPFSDPRVSQAISMAIDRDAIVHARGFGIWESSYQYTVPTRLGYVATPGYGVPSYNPDGARALLAEAGYPDGFSTTLIGQPGAVDRDSIVAIQAQLELVGIQASIELPETGGYAALRGEGWEGILVQRVLNMTYMEQTAVLLFTQQNNYFASMRFSDELDARIAAAMGKLGNNSAELTAIQDYLLEGGQIIPLWLAYDATILRPELRGWNEQFNTTYIPEMYFER